MPCDGGIGICRHDPCGQLACLNENGYCTDDCEAEDTGLPAAALMLPLDQREPLA
jgi:hypothetical protein